MACCGAGAPVVERVFFGTFLLCVALQCCYVLGRKKENPAKDLETMSNGITPFKLFLHKVVPSAYSHLIPVACVVVSL